MSDLSNQWGPYEPKIDNSAQTVDVQSFVPPDASLDNSNIVFYLDESGNKLMVRVKYSDGTLKTATISLS